ncbi:MAG: peptidoglycan-binding protein [Ilumatobacteraceae bacterium]|nr:peptidoglycan-binding protein [Ilumatobacteraceae bacterium]
MRSPQLRRLFAIGIVAIVVASLTPAHSPVQAAEGQLPASYVIYGRGYGHGRGLSQYGSYGWATVHGWSWQQILDFYYGGATGNVVAPIDNPNDTIRVWLSAMGTSQTGVVADVQNAVFLEDPVPGRVWTSLVAREVSEKVYRVWGSTTRRCSLSSQDPVSVGFELIGDVAEAASFTTQVGQDPAAAPTQTIGVCEPKSERAHRVRYYRGIIRAVNNSRNENRTINVTTMESYLRGVVPRESPASWGDTAGGAGMNALRAQSVAARSYAATETRYPGLANTCDSQDCQVYLGAALREGVSEQPYSLEDPRTDLAIAETAGVVIRGRNGAVVRTEFSSSNGGRTAGGIFTAQADAGDLSANSALMVWTRSVSAAQLQQKYPQIGTLTAITTAHDGQGGDWNGYTTEVTITGTSSAVKMSGWAFRTAFGLPAPWYGVTPIYPAEFEAAPVGRILLIGDSIAASITAEFTGIVTPAYTDINYQAVPNRCLVGSACVEPSVGLPDAPAIINALTPETMPTVAVLQLGYNDSPATFTADIDQVVTALTARAVQRIVFVNLSTRRVSVDYTASNAALLAATQRYPNVSVLDWNTFSTGPDKSRWFSDTVHLTNTGRVEFALFLRNQLDELRSAGLITVGSGGIIPMAVPMTSGERGEPVKAVQTALNVALGLKKKQRIAVDGAFGKGTVNALKKFEEASGLPIDGIADEQVIAALGIDHTTFTLARGATQSSVVSIQKALANVLKIKIRADGVYGSGTAKTVSRFQKSVGLKTTGVVDRTTWMALLSASAQR